MYNQGCYWFDVLNKKGKSKTLLTKYLVRFDVFEKLGYEQDYPNNIYEKNTPKDDQSYYLQNPEKKNTASQN